MKPSTRMVVLRSRTQSSIWSDPQEGWLQAYIWFDPEVGITLVGSNISQWVDKVRGFAATAVSGQPIYVTLGNYKYVQVFNNNSKVLTFSRPANSGNIEGRAYFGFGNSVFACNISIPNSVSATTLELGRYGDYLTDIIIFKGFPPAAQESAIINALKSKISNTPSKVINNFFFFTDSRLSNYLTSFSGNTLSGVTNAVSAWQSLSFINFTDNIFPDATDLTKAWSGESRTTTITNFSNNTFTAATTLLNAFYSTSITNFSNNTFTAATTLSTAWNGNVAVINITNNFFPNVTTLASTWAATGRTSNLQSFTNNSFPLVTTLASAWWNNTVLTTFSRFNSPNVVNVSTAWQNCKLTQESVDNILISLAAGVANNTTKTGFVGTNALTGGTNAAPGTTIRTLTNSWETALSQVNETLGGTTYNFSGGITGQQAKAWLLAKKNWTIQTN